MPSDSPPTTDHTLFRGWLRMHGMFRLRLKEDLRGAAYEPVYRAGDVVEARWHEAQMGFVAGWQVSDCGFTVRLQPGQVEVVQDVR
ncbi:MAG: hypothetical protein ACRYG8_44005 [Janthinobacterium lividum]